VIAYRGNVVPVFSVPPNWNKPVRVKERWDDIVAETLDTGEERIGVRPRPLYSIAYLTLTLTAQETGYIRKVLEQDDASPIAVALWQDARRLTAPTIAGNVFCNCEDTAGTLFDVVPFALLWKSFRELSTVRTLEVHPTGLVFADGIDLDFDAPDVVIPLCLGKISRDNLTSLTDENATFAVKFDEFSYVDAPILCTAIAGTDLDVTLAMEFECDGGSLL
jgi:hypothetical protein